MGHNRLSRVAIVALTTTLTLLGCSKEEAKPVSQKNPSEAQPVAKVGGLYATHDQDGTWRVVKVLAVDADTVHLRSYANKFQQQPTEADLPKLTLGKLGDGGGFGIGHFPVAKEGFAAEERTLIKVEPVKEDELEGYKMYLEAMKGGG